MIFALLGVLLWCAFLFVLGHRMKARIAAEDAAYKARVQWLDAERARLEALLPPYDGPEPSAGTVVRR